MRSNEDMGPCFTVVMPIRNEVARVFLVQRSVGESCAGFRLWTAGDLAIDKGVRNVGGQRGFARHCIWNPSNVLVVELSCKRWLHRPRHGDTEPPPDVLALLFASPQLDMLWERRLSKNTWFWNGKTGRCRCRGFNRLQEA